MLVLRGLQRIKLVLFKHSETAVRSLNTTPSGVQHSEDTFVKMENPYREPQMRGCVLCRVPVDFRNTQLLSQFISPHTGRIYGRHITRLCSQKQKEVSKAIKKAQALGFMSVTHKHPAFMTDPNICSKPLD